MTQVRRIICYVAIACLALPVNVRAGGPGDAPWTCPKGEESACIPNPKSYGFYPTRWRKWPSAKPNGEEVGPGKPAKPEKGAAPAETEEMPGLDNRINPTPEEETPDLMPSDPNRPGSKSTLPPELKSDLPQPPDLESLLPPSGADEPQTTPTPQFNPTPPATPRTPPGVKPPKDEPKEIPSDEDPFKDDPLMPGETGATGRRAAPVAASVPGQMRWRPDPRVKPASAVAEAKPVTVPAELKPVTTPVELKSIPPQDAIKRPVAEVEPRPAAAPAPVALPNPVVPAAAPKPPIVLADAAGAREPVSRPGALVANTPGKVVLSRANPLRSATSGMVLPAPMAEAEEVIPVADWTAEPAAPAEAPASVSSPASGSSPVWRANPLRGGR